MRKLPSERCCSNGSRRRAAPPVRACTLNSQECPRTARLLLPPYPHQRCARDPWQKHHILEAIATNSSRAHTCEACRIGRITAALVLCSFGVGADRTPPECLIAVRRGLGRNQ